MDMIAVARDSNNVAFNQVLGINKNWFGIVLGFASKRTKGITALDVATEASEELLLALYSKEGKFAEGMAALLEKGDENEIVAYFTNAAAIRVRRLAGRYQRKRDNVTVHFSALDDDDNRSYDVAEAPESEFVIGEMVRQVVEELDSMSAEAKDPRTARRLQTAKEVAAKRLENVPEFVPMDELLTMFPDVKKTSMHVILNDIQTAWETVCERENIPVRKIA